MPWTSATPSIRGALGKQLAALLDPEAAVPGVTAGKPRPELKVIAVIGKADGTQLDPNRDCEVNARWGIAGKGGICMPGKGRLITAADGTTHDVCLNDTTRWETIPAAVWDYTLGGYPVLKKWLSYRESALLGRALTADEAAEFTRLARRIAALLALAGKLDANYAAVG